MKKSDLKKNKSEENDYEKLINEIHKIREEILKEGKNLSPKEYAEFINKQGSYIKKTINKNKVA